MTPEERQALREKHYNCDPGELDLCNHCKDDYPCDVIKALDELELAEERLYWFEIRELSKKPCDHIKGYSYGDIDGPLKVVHFVECSLCGEKL